MQKDRDLLSDIEKIKDDIPNLYKSILYDNDDDPWVDNKQMSCIIGQQFVLNTIKKSYPQVKEEYIISLLEDYCDSF